ncbi:hypothetical protein [uncultured Rummeliibacillus sp.]|uniref:hypothetical protein n=1 Tax=uncultured Rummeliibacillus sp. TaxID=762292 RepID=UPI00260C7F87|nr:hypothetical protein [uncultured Rummeliibacillus sp.]
MTEALIICGFLFVLMVIQIKEQMQIKIKAKTSTFRRLLSFGLAILLLYIFWQPNLANQLKLVAFSMMILISGFGNEGLATDHLVKLGIISEAYTDYEFIQIEKIPNQSSFVTFHKTKNSHFSMFYDEKNQELINYFEKLGLEEKLIIGEMPDTIYQISIKQKKA